MGITMEYPLSPKYIPDWSIGEALRELIANALDTNSNPKIAFNRGIANISDEGDGIPKSFWVIGEGNHGEIGQFGEGLKMAMLVMARLKRPISVHTVGYTVRPKLAYSEVYESEVLVLESESNYRACGTDIEVECSEDEIDEAGDRFLKLNSTKSLVKDLGLLGSPGEIYISGVYVQSVASMWGYNITDKSLANRDRSVLDMNGVLGHIARVISRLTSPKLIVDLLVAGTTDADYLETKAYLDIQSGYVRGVWRRAFKRHFGAKTYVADGSANDKAALGLGMSIINLPWGLRRALINSGVLSTTRALQKMSKTKVTLLSSPLTPDEELVFNKAKNMARALVPDALVASTKVAEEFPQDGQCSIEGMYRGQTVYIHRDCLVSLAKAVGILVHERLHGTGLHDETRGFENAMTKMLGELAAYGGSKASTIK